MRTLLPDWTAGPPATDLVPLRLAGGLHALALSGRHPALTALYPPAAERLRRRRRWCRCCAACWSTRPGCCAAFLASAPQTNEVMRSAVLIGGYAAVAQATGLPLALREIGASAGLNLLWDRFHYRLGAQRWGDAASPVQIGSDWRGTPPLLPAAIAVADRRGNDLRAGGPARPAGGAAPARLRVARPGGTCGAAARRDRAGAAAAAAPWTPAMRPTGWSVSSPRRPTAWPPCSCTRSSGSTCRRPRARASRRRSAAAGARATRHAPLAWLRMEFYAAGAPAELRLTLWPDGDERTLARAHPHGEWVEWLG